jgi:SsrA-binding protein
VSASERKVICQNRRARHRYHVEDTIEAGIVLAGPEVKSLRAGQANLSDGYARIRRGEAWLANVHIAPYPQASGVELDPDRERKLLLHRREIDKLGGKLREKGLTLVPLELYFSDGRVKVKLGLARGKKTYDRRQDIARREAERSMERARKRRGRGR